MRFALRIPGDGRFAQKEFDVIPPKGVLLPNCSQKVQIDFISVNVKARKSDFIHHHPPEGVVHRSFFVSILAHLQSRRSFPGGGGV